MLAVLAVTVISNLLNILISLYFSYEQYSTVQTFNGIFAMGTVGRKADGNTNVPGADNVYVTIEVDDMDMLLKDFDMQDDILHFSVLSKDSEQVITISRNMLESITEGNGWLQVIDSTGKEIGSINKPKGVKTYYTTAEIEWASVNPIKMEQYYVRTIPEKVTDSSDQQIDMTYVIGIPQPEVDLKTMVNYHLDYFRVLDTQKLVSLIVTLVIALILGYLLAVRLNRPVVRMTDSIAAMAGGNYDVDLPQDSLYKDVFKSLQQMSQALKAAEQEREKIENMREEWITNISHDLKTPLSSIRGYGELLYETGRDMSVDDLQKYIRVVLEKSAYMDVLINDLKLTQRLKNENFPIQKEKGNLAELLRDTVIDILNDPRYEGRLIHFDCEAEDLVMEFDPHLFKRAFTNLVMNAVVHNPEDTEIWVRAHRDEGLIVEISDNGNGISDSDQEKLFHRYYRGTSTNASYDGSGLGLAIAREIIEAHAGKIELDSRLGEGTTIRIRLS